MPQPRIIAFDVDPASLACLREAFPRCAIDVQDGTTGHTLDRDWDPEEAELLVVRAGGKASRTLALCRGLRGQAGRALTPLLVLVPPEQTALIAEALRAGAHSCLVLPVHVKELEGVLTRARAGNQPGRHTLNLDRAQLEDGSRDTGGEG
jgi:DNA-binding response OmpR family regulator